MSQDASDENQRDTQTHMAVVLSKGNIGVAWYDSACGEMYVLQAQEETTGPFAFQLLHLAKLRAAPQVVYISARSDSALIDSLRDCSVQGIAAVCDVRLEKSRLFSYEAALRCLQLLNVTDMPRNLDGHEHTNWLNSVMSLSATQQVCAAGALLAILQRDDVLSESTAATSNSDDMDVDERHTKALLVASLAEVSLSGFLNVDAVSQTALSIFQEEQHPGKTMGIGSTKEGFSVFGVLDKCVTSMGRRLLRLWFMRPIVDLDALNDRQDAIQVLAGVPDTCKALRDILRHIKDVPKQLQRLQAQSVRGAKDFSVLTDSLAKLLLLRGALASAGLTAPARAGGQRNNASSMAEESYPAGNFANRASSSSPSVSQAAGRGRAAQPAQELGIVRRSLSRIGQAVQDCHGLVADIIDVNQEEGSLVAAGVSDRLDQLKAVYHALPGLLTRVVEAELARIPRALSHSLSQQTWTCVYVPQMGFAIRLEGGLLTADLEDVFSDFEVAFEGGDKGGTFYHSDRTRALNAQYGDMLHKILDLEASICNELLRRLAKHHTALVRAMAAAGEVDCLVAMAMAAHDYGWCRPELTTDNVLEISQGKHLLTELVTDTYIPNDTKMTAHQGRVQVITGPNFSGKSCYAKQVALIVFLAHVGSFVPARSARIGLTDRIFTRVACREAVTVPQSAFLIDLTQISSMLRHATCRSLCIIDEFGKGTLASDGIGLLCAALQHFADQRPAPPKVIACTHFSEILHGGHIRQSPQLALVTMDVLTEASAPEAAPDKGLIFLYRLVPGCAALSFGVHCARLAGLDPRVLQRAKQVMELRGAHKAVLPVPSPGQAAKEAWSQSLTTSLGALQLQDTSQLQAFVRSVLHDDPAAR
ncbi:hypothetical protein WJX81_003661 [Elliptochloris bilobata]|uniref:DNA mismatch repair protein MSH5 n=1 Tax=Elliptochloris bilobata TaxID=381761 RepID=A0AAW1QJ03_9CHLO